MFPFILAIANGPGNNRDFDQNPNDEHQAFKPEVVEIESV
jgi:hypothetical protein